MINLSNHEVPSHLMIMLIRIDQEGTAGRILPLIGPELLYTGSPDTVVVTRKTEGKRTCDTTIAGG